MPGREDLIQRNIARAAAQGQPPVPGVPLPSDNFTSGSGSSPGNANPSLNSTAEVPSGPKPQRVPNYEIKSKLLRPALTSHFQCIFNPPNVDTIRRYYLDGGSRITLLCSEASLPGSSLITNEINDDYTGVTERLGYRKQYDDRADFTFYVDQGTQNGGYNVIRLFEEWMRYAMGEKETTGANYSYRVRFPDEPGTGYRTDMFIQKFEKDFGGNYLEYVFVKAYPISITSMPVSYDSSQLLKCTVSFTYNRYVLRNRQHSVEKEPSQQPATGVPSPEDVRRINQNRPVIGDVDGNPLPLGPGIPGLGGDLNSTIA